MSPKPRLTTIASIGIFLITLLMLTLVGACSSSFDRGDPGRDQAKKGPAQVSVENGQTVLTLDTATQNRLGLEVVTLATTVTRQQFTSPAVVLSVQDLATSRNSYVAMQAQLQATGGGASAGQPVAPASLDAVSIGAGVAGRMLGRAVRGPAFWVVAAAVVFAIYWLWFR